MEISPTLSRSDLCTSEAALSTRRRGADHPRYLNRIYYISFPRTRPLFLCVGGGHVFFSLVFVEKSQEPPKILESILPPTYTTIFVFWLSRRRCAVRCVAPSSCRISVAAMACFCRHAAHRACRVSSCSACARVCRHTVPQPGPRREERCVGDAQGRAARPTSRALRAWRHAGFRGEPPAAIARRWARGRRLPQHSRRP